jgi:hypothetical protein
MVYIHVYSYDTTHARYISCIIHKIHKCIAFMYIRTPRVVYKDTEDSYKYVYVYKLVLK